MKISVAFQLIVIFILSLNFTNKASELSWPGSESDLIVVSQIPDNYSYEKPKPSSSLSSKPPQKPKAKPEPKKTVKSDFVQPLASDFTPQPITPPQDHEHTLISVQPTKPKKQMDPALEAQFESEMQAYQLLHPENKNPMAAFFYVMTMIVKTHPNPVEFLANEKFEGEPLATVMALMGDTECFKTLLQLNLNPDQIADRVSGDTSLHCAATFGDLEKTVFILARNANPNARNFIQETPLLCAAHHGRAEIVRALATYNPGTLKALFSKLPTTTMNAQDWKGNSALHHAVDNGDAATFAILMNYQELLDLQNRNKQTPLHRAVIRLNVEFVRDLLQRGAQKTITDNCNFTPIDLCEDLAAQPGNKNHAEKTAKLAEILRLLNT